MLNDVDEEYFVTEKIIENVVKDRVRVAKEKGKKVNLHYHLKNVVCNNRCIMDGENNEL